MHVSKSNSDKASTAWHENNNISEVYYKTNTDLKILWLCWEMFSLGQAAAWNHQCVVTVCHFPGAGPCKALLPAPNQGMSSSAELLLAGHLERAELQGLFQPEPFWDSVILLKPSAKSREVKEAVLLLLPGLHLSPLIFPPQNFLLGLYKMKIRDSVFQFISSLQIFWSELICESFQYFRASLAAAVPQGARWPGWLEWF